MKKRYLHNQHQQSGAIWAEFIVVSSFVLISVFTLVPMMGKMIDTKHKVEQAGRYTGWERTVWFQNKPRWHPTTGLQKSNAELQNEIHQRVFADNDSVLHSRQRRNLDNITYDPMLRFQNPTKRGRQRYDLLLEKKGEVSGKDRFITTTQREDKPPGQITTVTNGIIGTLSRFGSFDVNTKGYYTGTVAVDIKEFTWFREFNGVTPTFQTRTAILADGWNAGGPRDVKGRVTPFFPQDWLNGPVLNTIQTFGGFFFRPLRPSSLEIGKVDVEPVPETRLKRY